MSKNTMTELMYNELLSTPGFDLVFAIGMTYSLSLEAMLSVPIAFGLLGELDDTVKRSPIGLLEAVRKSSDKFLIFCNKGGITVPNEVQTLYSLMEDRIVEVYDEKDYTANFHPKLWIIKERSRESEVCQLKLIVLSRNLTFDNSIDVACSLTGIIGSEVSSLSRKHEPIKQLLEKLCSFTDSEKKKPIREIITDLSKVERFQLDEDIYEKDGYDFFPIWFGTVLNQNPKLKEALKGDDSIVVSPFIDKSTLKSFISPRMNYYPRVLITRKEYIDEDIFNIYKDKGEIYAVNDTFLDNDIAKIDLHAKMYLVRLLEKETETQSQRSTYLYLGSANATYSAFNRNSEFLVRFKYKSGKKYIFEDFVENFVNEDRKFERVLSPVVKECINEYSDVEKKLKKFVSLKITASAAVTNELATVTITVKDFCEELKDVSISMLQLPSLKMQVSSQIKFFDIPIDKLSELYVVSLSDGAQSKSIVFKIKTEGIPENRNDLIFSKIVDTPQKFIDYVSFMLSENPTEMIASLSETEMRDKKVGGINVKLSQPKVYEQMLKLAYKKPSQLREIGDFMNRIDQKVVMPEFKKMYESFMSIINTLEKL